MIKNNRGHVLVILLFFMILAVTVITASVSLMILSSSGTTMYISGNQAKVLAEVGIENALVRLLRDPNYSGENLVIGDGSVEVSVSGLSIKTITATGKINNQIKRIEVLVELNNN